MAGSRRRDGGPRSAAAAEPRTGRPPTEQPIARSSLTALSLVGVDSSSRLHSALDGPFGLLHPFAAERPELLVQTTSLCRNGGRSGMPDKPSPRRVTARDRPGSAEPLCSV